MGMCVEEGIVCLWGPLVWILSAWNVGGQADGELMVESEHDAVGDIGGICGFPPHLGVF